MTLAQLGDAVLGSIRRMTPEEREAARRAIDEAFGMRLVLTDADRNCLRDAGVKPW